MTSINVMTNFQVIPQSYINGATTNYKIIVTPSVPMVSGDKLQFTFPPEVTVPSSISCSTSTLVSSVSCSNSGSSVLATFTYSSTINAGTSFAFFVNSLKNPPNTLQTSDFTGISSYDSSNNQISTYPNMKIQMQTPATVLVSALS